MLTMPLLLGCCQTMNPVGSVRIACLQEVSMLQWFYDVGLLLQRMHRVALTCRTSAAPQQSAPLAFTRHSQATSLQAVEH